MIYGTCKICGAKISSINGLRKYCDACGEAERLRKSAELNRVNSAKYRENARQKKTREEAERKRKMDGMTLSEVARAATAAGMTYGKYVAKLNGGKN